MQRKVICRRNIFGNELSFYFRTRSESGIGVAEPLVIKLSNPEDLYVEPMPTFTLLPEEAQALMDSMWDAGLRPTEGSGSAGAMAATQRHLEDMRTLVFKPQS